MTEPTPEAELSRLTDDLTEAAQRNALDDAVHELAERRGVGTTGTFDVWEATPASDADGTTFTEWKQ